MHKHSFHTRFVDGEHICAITLFRNELIYDIDFASNRVARIQITEEEIKKAALVTTEDISKDVKQDYIDRLIRHALADIRKKMAFAVRDDRSRMATDEIEAQEPQYSIVFGFERGWQGSPQGLCDYIHSYVVNKVLQEWFEITLPQQAQYFNAKAIDDMRNIQSIGRAVILDGVQGFYL